MFVGRDSVRLYGPLTDAGSVGKPRGLSGHRHAEAGGHDAAVSWMPVPSVPGRRAYVHGQLQLKLAF